jgi:hypothetical protein
VLKLYVSHGSEREYVLVNGRKPLSIYDLKQALFRMFKIGPDQQCIVHKGYNLHDYIDETPLEAFGLENNSPISFWYKLGNNNPLDVRLPTDRMPQQQQQMPEAFSPRSAQLQAYQLPPLPQALPPIQPQQQLQQQYSPTDGTGRWPTDGSVAGTTEVVKVNVQHGSDVHSLILKGLNKNVTVVDLQTELERITTVPMRDQRLFYKAQELNAAPYKTLKEYDIENNSVIKMVGEPSKWKYQNYFGRVAPPAANPANSNTNAGGDPSALKLQQIYNPQLQQQQQQQPIAQQGYGGQPQQYYGY